MSIISALKKLPIDVGQAERKHDSAGKLIAFSYIKDLSSGTQKKALDIGCRDGYWSEKLKQKGYEVLALDLDPQYAGALRHDVENGLPYSDKSIDVVWCTEVIEHLRRPQLIIDEVERVLKDDGIAVFTTPNSFWWFYYVVRLWGWTPQKLQNPDHKQFFKKKELEKIAKNYTLLGYFPYAIRFFPIKILAGLLSPTFILIRKRPYQTNAN